MDEEQESKANNFLSASELLKIKNIGNSVWEDLQKSEVSLPKVGKKFEPSGSWLEDMQLDNGLKNRKRVIEIERVERHSHLASAEWLPNIQKARVTKKSGQKWENFGYEEKSQLYLLPEEALILLEMGCLELVWSGLSLSIQHAYEILINIENSKCTLDEYRVYSHLVRRGYRLQRIKEKIFVDKSVSATKRIIMNIDGLWTPNTSPTIDKDTSDSNGSTSKSSSEETRAQENNINPEKKVKTDNGSSPKKIEIISDETLLGNNYKIIKLKTVSENQTQEKQKWPGSRIQRNVKLMPKRSNIVNSVNNTNIDTSNYNSDDIMSVKRKNPEPASVTETLPAKIPKPEIIELLSDDDIEVIPRPMTRMEILNTLPNLASSRDDSLVAEIHRKYLPPGVKPVKDFYRFNCKRLLCLPETDRQLRLNIKGSSNNNIKHNNGTRPSTSNHFYSQPNQCETTAITHYDGSNNGYSYRGCQRQVGPGSYNYQQQNVSIHNSLYTCGTVFQSNYVNFVTEVMGNMVRSSWVRQQQYQGTTFCQNFQVFQQASSPRFPFSQPYRFQSSAFNSVYSSSPSNQYYNRRIGHTAGFLRGRGGFRNSYNNSNNIELQRLQAQEEIYQSSFTKCPGVESWSELKKKWREESTITIEDEEPMQQEDSINSNDVKVVESIKPLIDSNTVSSMSEVYERLRIIKSVTGKTVRSRKVDYHLSYDVYAADQHYKKSTPGTPMCRLYVADSKKDSCLDASKLQRLQQESKEVPVVVAFVSQSCISYMQHGVVLLPNLL